MAARSPSCALEVDHGCTTQLAQPIRMDLEHRVGAARRGPHHLVAEKVAIHEDGHLGRVAKRRHAADRITGGGACGLCVCFDHWIPGHRAEPFSSTRFAPLTSATTGVPPATNTRDLTI